MKFEVGDMFIHKEHDELADPYYLVVVVASAERYEYEFWEIGPRMVCKQYGLHNVRFVDQHYRKIC